MSTRAPALHALPHNHDGLHDDRAARIVIIAILAPLPALILGAVIAHAHGVAWEAFLPNVLGGVVGAGGALGLGLTNAGSRFAHRWLPLGALACLAATLAFPGDDGVRRWLPLVGLRLNASAAMAPFLLLPLVSLRPQGAWRSLVLVVAAQSAHIAQPDAGQATALAAGSIACALGGAYGGSRKIVGALFVAALAVVAWLRPDPLPPVDHVERILAMVGESGGASVTLALVAGLCLLAPFVVLARSVEHAETKTLAMAFVAMLVASFAATFLGSFPVAVFGAGAGGVLGWYAMLAALAASRYPMGAHARRASR